MSPGSHAANDGSFARSTGIQVGRGALLIGAAIAIGLILLHHPGGRSAPVAVGNPPDTSLTLPQTSSSVAGGGSGPGTTARPSNTTSTAPVRAPQDIKALVANGTSTPGLAASISNLVHAKGYNTLASTNSSQKLSATIVYFTPSYSSDAAALAAKFNLPPSAVQAMPSPPPVANLNGANILIIVGPDLANAKSTTSST